MTVEGGAHAPRHETGAAHAHAPGRGGGGIAAGPAPAAEATVTATSRAPDTSKQSSQQGPMLVRRLSLGFAWVFKYKFLLDSSRWMPLLENKRIYKKFYSFVSDLSFPLCFGSIKQFYFDFYLFFFFFLSLKLFLWCDKSTNMSLENRLSADNTQSTLNTFQTLLEVLCGPKYTYNLSLTFSIWILLFIFIGSSCSSKNVPIETVEKLKKVTDNCGKILYN